MNKSTLLTLIILLITPTLSIATLEKPRFDKVNDYLLLMHDSKNYSDDFQFYLSHLEKSDNLHHLDTVARVYLDHGYKQRALDLYRARILPWIKIEDAETQNEFNAYYAAIKASEQHKKLIKIKKPSLFKAVEDRGKRYGKIRK